MNFNIFKTLKPKHVGKAALGLSAAGAMALNMLIIPWEKDILKPYLDVGGVPTACGGVTGPNITKAFNEGKVFTQPECDNLNARAVAIHEIGLRNAINDNIEKEIPDLTMAAYISWVYNVGVGSAQSSTLVKLINKKEFKLACEQLPRWTRVKGRIVAGLENRRYKGDNLRMSEQSLCMIGLDPSYETPLFEKYWFNYQRWIEDVIKT